MKRLAIALVAFLVWCALPSAEPADAALRCADRGICHKVAHTCTQQVNTQVLNVGTSSFTIPANVTLLSKVSAIAGGGGAANGGNGGKGGGGGAYSEVDNVAVTPGNVLSLSIGSKGSGGAASTSGTSGTAGTDTSVSYLGSQILLAKAGQPGTDTSPGTGGAASGGVGTIKTGGGAGGDGATGGGGGGGAGGPHGDGVAGAAGSPGGFSGPPFPGGNGGAGDAGFGGAGGLGSTQNNVDGGNGGNGAEFGTAGSGGGGGGGVGGDPQQSNAGFSGNYGAGGGGTGFGGGTFPAGRDGTGGVVVVQFTFCGNVAPPPPQNSFFVAATGIDTAPGTLAAPFLTFGRCQAAMRNSSTTKTCTIRAGTYNFTSGLALTSADAGETWQYFTADGVDTAVIDGGNTVDGLIVGSSGANNITINGLKLQNPIALAIQVNHGSGWLIENNDIGFNHNNNSALGYGGFAPMIDASGLNNTVTNNYVHDCASQCIAAYAFGIGERIDGVLVTKNVVLRAVQQADDGGGIYVNMHATSTLGGHVTISNNYVKDQGGQLIGGAAGIYLDDNASNVTVTGNLVGPVPANWQGSAARRDADCIEIFGGVTPTMEAGAPNQPQNDTIKNNVCDLGFTARMLIVGAGPSQGQTNNVFQNNIVIANYAGATNTQQFCAGQEYCAQSPGFTVQNNAYNNYGGGAETTTGTPNDSSPQHYSGAQLGLICTNAIYTQAGNTVVNGAPVSFPGLPSGWGPIGFTIPSSTNHSC